MAVKVVDTNVWVMIDRVSDESDQDIDCAQTCSEWGKEFRESDNRIALDSDRGILDEYRGKIRRGGSAELYVNILLSTGRVEFRDIEFDDGGIAIVPNELSGIHKKDRKFVAVALQFPLPAPIINAADSGWKENRESLINAGIPVEELCS